jgi:hypothetical protein
MESSSKIYWFGKIMPPSTGVKYLSNDFEQKDIDNMRLEGMPICRMHNPDHVLGEIIDTYRGKSGALYAVGCLYGGDDKIGDVVYENEIDKKELTGLSLSHRLIGAKDNNKTRILKLLLEVSVVKEAQRKGTRIFCCLRDKDLEMATTVPVVLPPTETQPPAPAVPEPAKTEHDPMDFTEEELLKEEKADLAQLLLMMNKERKEHQAIIAKAKEFEAQQSEKVKKGLEDHKQQLYNSLLKAKGKGEADNWLNNFNDSISGKTLEELEKTRNVFSTVAVNFSQSQEMCDRLEKQLNE